ncbi:hypothetical protein [Microcoleus sp. bin38.metabat.b11b12b14.051]|uniref:hypothetical protein n=1 Tax=Microcoleus sp. bin38.metabat.b11b12b14.051 TaxID=2742709 RepID=UPI0025F8423A|nr:hypothetical protein [Microcoleus sp. bin38.metabat.b11b12b14.051]
MKLAATLAATLVYAIALTSSQDLGKLIEIAIATIPVFDPGDCSRDDTNKIGASLAKNHQPGFCDKSWFGSEVSSQKPG